MMLRASRGLGMFPDHPCYDPSRPGWLPYWLDTFSEETCAFERLAGKDTRLNFPPPALAPPVQRAPASALTYPYQPTDADTLNALRQSWDIWRTQSGTDIGSGPGLAETPWTKYLLWGLAIAIGLIFLKDVVGRASRGISGGTHSRRRRR